jgi:pyridoxine kinase
MNILSIQSWVAYGHVGNAAAIFPLQRLGFEAWAINTVQFSNHTGYGAWRGQVFAPGHVAELVDGIAERGALGRCDAVLSGYMGDAGLGEAILDAVARVKAANPKALFCCDPVIGDVGRGVFVRPGIPEFLRDRAVPVADILTPNHFELERLAGREIATLGEALDAARRLRDRGVGTVLVTSFRRRRAGADKVEMLAVGEAGAWLVATPLLPIAPNGGGDLTAALFLAHLLQGEPIGAALAATAGSVWGIIEATMRAGARELQLVAAQQELVRPSRSFRTRRVARADYLSV